MTEFLVQPVGVRLTWSLVHFLWQGAAIAALLTVVLRSMTTLKPHGRYLLSMAALVLMAVCPLATWFALGEIELPAATMQPFVTADERELGAAFDTFASTAHAGESDVTFEQFGPALQPYLLFAWLTGVILLGGRLLWGYIGTLWIKSGRTPVPFDLVERAIAIGRRLGVNANDRVFGCLRVPEAVAIGFWKPIVLVPACWLTELPPSVLEAVIAHELAHIRRWDLWATLAQRVIETLLFYHPAVWWLSRRISLEREMCCDELAVLATGRPVVYAQVLEYLGGRMAAVTSLTLATSFKGERDMNLLTRVQHVLGMRTKPEAGRLWLAGVLSLAAVLAILALSSGQIGRNAVADDEPAPRAREGERRDRAADAPREGQPRRAAEGRDSDRKPAEGEGRRTSLGEGERRSDAAQGADEFKPQTDREQALYQMILQLRKETAALRQQLNQVRGGAREGSAKDVIRRDSDKTERPIARDGDAPVRREARDGDRKPTGPRDGEKKETGPRDGEERKAGTRDGEKKETGPRDGEERKAGTRDGDAPKPAARDGEGDKPRARDGEGDKPRDRDRDSE